MSSWGCSLAPRPQPGTETVGDEGSSWPTCPPPPPPEPEWKVGRVPEAPPPLPRRHALPLFTSLLNTVCAYDPVGYGIPYNHLLFSDYREPLVEEAAQVLIVTLDHDSATSASPTVDGTTTGTAMDDADVSTGESGPPAPPGCARVAPPLAARARDTRRGPRGGVWGQRGHCHLGLG